MAWIVILVVPSALLVCFAGWMACRAAWGIAAAKTKTAPDLVAAAVVRQPPPPLPLPPV